MKALVLAAGRGTRLRPLTHTLPKQLIPLSGDPILHHVLVKIAEAGLREVGLVVGPETCQPLGEYVGDGSPWGLQVNYILQEQPRGLAHAVKVSRDYLGQDAFLMYLGDNLIQGSLKSFLKEYERRKADASVILKAVPNPSAFGIAEVDSRGQVTRIVEKPVVPPTNLAVIGIYAFSPRIHDAIEGLKPSPRGEYEITDAIQRLMEMGGQARSHREIGWWQDTGSVKDLLEANHILLKERVDWTMEGRIEESSLITGRLACGPGTVLRNVVVNGPVIIGLDCRLDNVTLGPDVCLGDDCELFHMSVSSSIVMEGSRLMGTSLTNSLLGRRNHVHDAVCAREMKMLLGDDSILEFDQNSGQFPQ